MEVTKIIESLRDPMGIPFYPILFQFLMVLTFAIHILFVNFTLGTSFLSIYGFFKKEEFWRKLSRSLVRATTLFISMAMLFGIAPLLFVQVIYDPFWYTSNTLSAFWVVFFILVMMTAYGLTYVFYYKYNSAKERGFGWIGIFAFLLFLVAGFIMHVINFQLLQPKKWLSWYFRGSSVDASGLSIHSFQLSRFLHFITPAFAMTGIYLLLYAWYFREREDMDRAYLKWLGEKGANLAFFFTILQIPIGIWWLLRIPYKFKFYLNPLLHISIFLGLILLITLYLSRREPFKYAILSGVLAFLTIFTMSYAREVLRMKYLAEFKYSIFNSKLNIDWGSTLLFLFTFLMGLVVAGYLLSIAFRSGRKAGEYTASPALSRFGKVSIALLIIWIIIVAGLGVVITISKTFKVL
ncbi:MAG: hypothetical protein ACUVUG_09770 [Candidatus Aminicenantia bacterium]